MVLVDLLQMTGKSLKLFQKKVTLGDVWSIWNLKRLIWDNKTSIKIYVFKSLIINNLFHPETENFS